jgi:uncharacterized protein YoxC
MTRKLLTDAPKSVEEYDEFSLLEKVNLALFRSSIWKMIQDAKQLDSDINFINSIITSVMKTIETLQAEVNGVVTKAAKLRTKLKVVIQTRMGPSVKPEDYTPREIKNTVTPVERNGLARLNKYKLRESTVKRELQALDLMIQKLNKEIFIRHQHRSEINIALMMSHVTKELRRLDRYDYSQSAKKIEYEIECFLHSNEALSSIASVRQNLESQANGLDEASSDITEDLIYELLFTENTESCDSPPPRHQEPVRVAEMV